MNPRNVVAVVAKDLRDVRKNHLWLLMLAMPILLWLIFHLLPGASPLKMALIVFDQGSSSLVRRLSSQPMLEVQSAGSEEEVRQKVSEGEGAGIILDSEFDVRLKRGERPNLRIYLNAAKQKSLQGLLLSLLDATLRSMAAQPSVVAWEVVKLNEESVDATQPQNTDLLVSPLIVAILLVGTMFVPALVVEEREKRTLDAILLSPTSTWEFILGKAIVGLMFSLVVCGLLLLLSGQQQNNIGPLLVSIFVGAWLLVAIGLLEGAFFSNVMQTNAWGSMVFLLLFLPPLMTGATGGLAQGMRLIPSWYLYQALSDSVGHNVVWANVWPNILVMTGFAVFLGFLGPMVLHKGLQRR